MDLRDPSYVPEGWIKTTRNGRTIFKTNRPNLILIQNKKMLQDYQKQGRFEDADAEQLDFRALKDLVTTENVCDVLETQINVGEEDEVPVKKKRKLSPAEEEKEKIEFGTQRLQVSSSLIDHSKELEAAAQLIANVIHEADALELKLDVKLVKEELAKAETDEEFVRVLTSRSELYDYFSVLFRAKSLSQMINLPLSPTSPLVGWPCDVNENIYAEVVKLACNEAKEVLAFLCSVIVPKDQPIGKQEVIRVADMFSTLAHSVSKKQNALSKLKSVVLQAEGLITAGIDRVAKVKGAECSATLSRGRYLLGELGDSSFKSRVKQGRSFTITCDNLNLRQQNMTQAIIHMDKFDTAHLPDETFPLESIDDLFKMENFLLSSPRHVELLKHLKYVVAVRLGNILGEYDDEAQELKKFLPKSHKHGGSDDEKVPSEIFISPPDYLNEMENAEFFKFCLKKQSEFLYAVAESVENRGAFLDDLETIMCVKVIDTGILESDLEVLTRENAERRVHEEVGRFGRWIGFGDALTFKQFHYGAKALARGNCTAYERLEYLSHFKLALFHAKMNKTYLDFPVLMPKRSMMEDEGTLPELVALAGIQGISIEEKKISNSYEKHDQLLMVTGHLYAVNMFKNYLKDNPDIMKQVKSEETAVNFVQQMLSHYDVEYYYNPDQQVAADKWDDAANYARDVIARMILAEVFDAGEEEEDHVLLRSLRLTMLVYFLNRKYKIQDSKYAAYLLVDEVMEQQASHRDRERMRMASCVNPSGKRQGGLFA